MISKLSKPHRNYQKLKSVSDIETSDNDNMKTEEKVELKKNKASDSDVIAFWWTAVQPNFRIRRGAVDEVRLKKDFRYLEFIMYEDVLRDYNMI